MYSVILATLLSTTAGESQQWHRRAYYGCQGYAFCYGCASCFTCYSCGCSGWYCYSSCGNCGCWYGCYGCYASYYYPTYVSCCHGCYSYPSCYTSYSYPVSSCCFSACHGCGVPIVVGSVTPPQGNVDVAQVTTSRPETLIAGSSNPQAAVPTAVASAPKNGPAAQPVSIPTNAARITVILPADAKLLVDGVECPLTSDVRSFNTPTLQTGMSYFYVMKMEVEKDGRTITESRRVRMTAGQHVEVNFNVPAETQTVVLK